MLDKPGVAGTVSDPPAAEPSSESTPPGSSASNRHRNDGHIADSTALSTNTADVDDTHAIAANPATPTPPSASHAGNVAQPVSHVAPLQPPSLALANANDDTFALHHLARFVGAGLAAGEGVLLIAPTHRCDALRDHLARNAFDVPRSTATGQLLLLDADEALARCMADGRNDPTRFRASMAPLLERIGSGRSGTRAFVELPDVLRARGQHAAAMRIERLWNTLAAEHLVVLSFGAPADAEPEPEPARRFDDVGRSRSYITATQLSDDATSTATRVEGSLRHDRHVRALEAELESLRARENARRKHHADLRSVLGDIDAHGETTQKLREVLDQMPCAVAIVEAPSGKLLLANEQNATIFRQPTVPLAGISAYARFRAIHEDGRELQPHEWPISRAVTTGEVVRGEEIHIVRADGSHGHVRVNASPIRDAKGNVVAGIVTYDDITKKREQRHTTEALLRVATMLRSELDVEALVQNLTDEATALCRAEFGSFFHDVTNEEGQRQRLYSLSGAPREAFASFPMPRSTSIFGPTLEDARVVRVDDVTKDPRYGRNAPHQGLPEGHLPVRSYLAIPVRTRRGEVLGGLFFGHSKAGVFTEADERLLTAIAAQAAIAIENARSYQAALRAEKRAQREKQRLHDLFVSAPASIWILRGPNRVVEFANPMALALFPGRDPIGKPLLEVFPRIDAQKLALVDDVFRTGERRVETEVATSFDWNRSGRVFERFFNFAYEPYRDENDDVVGVLVFAFEVTDWVVARRRVEAVVRELEIANRMKDDFLATVSHELRTPLSAILGWTRMLRSGMVADSQTSKALETIERNANAQTQLIEDLLDVSRIISGKMRLEVEDVDVEIVIANAIEAIRPAANAKGVALSHAVDPSVGAVRGDGGRLQQVVWNLLSNGVKFTPTGGRVDILARKRDAFVEIVVSDDGQGIDAEFLPHVFERFRQADATTTRKHMGLGLGLAIVRHLVELHGGHVGVESDGLGKGASFVVSLPTSSLRSDTVERLPAVRSTASPPSLAHPPELAGARILVVEDEDDARELLVHVLEPCGIRVSMAANVTEALAKVEYERPDIIVSDIGLPEEDGYAFVRKLRALPPNRGGRTPAVALTAYARVEDRTKALVSGFNMHVPKPVEPAELIAVLASLWALFPRA